MKPPERAPSAAAKPLPALWFIAAGVVFTVASVLQSMHQGQLAAPATYDDITYFIDAGRRLIAFYNAGFPALAEGYLNNAPHSPTSTATSFVGFLLFGFNEWSQALVNTIWVVALLLVVRRWFAGLPAWVNAVVVIAVLAWPVLGYLVIEGRPDIVNGFLLAFGCIGLVQRPWLSANRGRMVAIALVFAAALLTKPSVFPITLALYGFSLMVATGLDVLDAPGKVSIGRILGRNLVAFAITIVIVLPHYVLAVGREIAYIVTTTFTSQKELWAVKLPLYEQATFYLWGQGGHQTMAAWVFVTMAMVAIVVIGLILSRQSRSLRRVAGMALVFAVSFGFVSIPSHKSPYLGVQVTAFFFVFFLLATRALFTAALAGSGRAPIPANTSGMADAVRPGRVGSALGQLLAIVFGVAITGMALESFQWHWFHRTDKPSIGEPDVLAERRALIDAVYAAVKPKGDTVSKVYFPAIDYYLNADILTFAFVRRGDADDDAFDNHRDDTVATHLENIRAATHVVLVSPEDPDLLTWLPSAKSLPAVSAAVRADPTLVKIASLQPPLSGGPIEIYERKSAFETVRPGVGFLPREGPYPQWNLPKLRWAVGSDATLQLITPAPGPATLQLEVQSPVADQTVTASIAGRVQGQCTVAVAYSSTTCAIPVTIEAGDSEITLSFSKTDPSTDQKRAVILLNQSLQR